MAHVICTSHFAAGRSVDEMRKVEFGEGSNPTLSAYTIEVDEAGRSVTVSLPELASSTAVWREGLGCALAIDTSIEALRAQRRPESPRPPVNDAVLWPEGTGLDEAALGIDRAKLNGALDFAIAHAREGRGTRSVVVVHGGRLVGEAYAAGTTRDTPHYGASMTKSVAGMLIGQLVGDGRLSLADTKLRPEWQGADDPRGAITLDHLMRMSSALEFDETYVAESDANIMLFARADAAAYAAQKPLLADPGTRWSYSSGTTNILMAIARDTFGGDEAAYLAMPWVRLFEPLGLRTAVFETDPTGTYVGSSYLWASARDFARLGLLLLNDGVWGGERLLPEGWVRYMATPTPADPEHRYGGQIWLSGATDGAGPAPVMEMRGYGGQSVTVIPAHDLVVVRMGWDFGVDPWPHRAFLEKVIEAVRPASAEVTP
ncbi:MAG: serine hydrolase [Alphaproteobacteria bacterium]|nr:serine hydrolase [Alphaproteobacteria bacterium]